MAVLKFRAVNLDESPRTSKQNLGRCFNNSGFTGADFPFGTTFAATFTAPGRYHFICALHDDLGMTGTIVVLP